MNLNELKSIIDEMIDKGFGYREPVFSLWTANGRRDYFVHVPIKNQIIGNKDVVYIGIADDCLAHRSNSETAVMGELYQPTKSSPFLNVRIQFLGSQWFLFDEIRKGDESFNGELYSHRPLKTGQDLVNFCNDKHLHIVNRGNLSPEFASQLKY